MSCFKVYYRLSGKQEGHAMSQAWRAASWQTSSHMGGSGVFEEVKKPKVLERKLWKTSQSREEVKGVYKCRFRKVGKPQRTKW